MTTYNNFDQILNDKNLSEKDRISFTKSWLSKNYGVDSNANQEWVNILSDVHDHDNEPKHFGRVKLGTAFESIETQLVKIHNVWHIGIVKNNHEDSSVVIHSLNEVASQDEQNVKNRGQLQRLVKNGKLILIPATPSGVQILQPQTSFIPQTVTEFDDAPLSAPVTESDNVKLASISIDLTEYMK